MVLILVAATPVSATVFPIGYNPPAGTTVVNPEIDCNADPLNNTVGVAGIIVDDPNTTIINPEIRECVHGIRVIKKAGVMPTNVRIIADAAYPGYSETNFTLNRVAIMWTAGNGEVGDISAPHGSVGGELEFVDDFRYFHGVLTTSFRMHHTTASCVTCPTYSGADSPGAHWGLKFLADRTQGAPFEASGARFDHNDVDGFHDEGISFDTRGNEAGLRLIYSAGIVTARSARRDTISLSGVASTENTLGMYVVFNRGPAQGKSLKIKARLSNTFTVSDPANVLAMVNAGNRVSVGGRFHRNLIDHNLVHASDVKTGIDFHGGSLLSRIEANTIVGTPSFVYGAPFHTRGTPQCMMVRSLAGPSVPMFSFRNSVVGNTCRDAGDISATVISWGTYEVNSPTSIIGNTFTGSPLGQLHRYKS